MAGPMSKKPKEPHKREGEPEGEHQVPECSPVARRILNFIPIGLHSQS
jgi:hypothetical protein